MVATDAATNASTPLTVTGSITNVDEVAPLVTAVSSTAADGSYKAGDVIAITVSFDEAVFVSGTPQLTLNSGAVVNYSSGSGSSTILFEYTVQPGDTSADLQYISTTALAGGTITDAAGNSAVLTLPALADAASLAGGKAIVIDTTNPVFSSSGIATAIA